MPRSTLASQITGLRAQYDAAGPIKKRRIASSLWSLCLERAPAARLALPWLGELAVHEDEKLVWYGTNAMGRAGRVGRSALRRLLRHPREIVRAKAAYGLAQSGDHSVATLSGLARLLRSDSADDRIAALSALDTLAKSAERPGLLAKLRRPILAALDDPDSAVRSWAPSPVAATFRSPRQFLDYALVRLDQPPAHMRHELLSEAAESLEHVDPRRYLPAILRIVRANPPYVSWFLPALSRAGPDAADLVPLLERLAAEDSLDGLRAGGALLNIDGRDGVLKKLARRLPRSPDEIAGVLCGIGPAAAPIAPALARVIDANFDEPDWDLMWALTDALAAIESHTPVAVKALRKALSHESGIVQGAALRGLEQLGPSARAALPDVRRLRTQLRGSARRGVTRVIAALDARTN